ncbi:hypothetical protein AB4Z01_09005 [Inquilinus sp. YAF38]
MAKAPKALAIPISGTIQNSSWKAHKPRPPSLLNPTQYLIDLAARGS